MKQKLKAGYDWFKAQPPKKRYGIVFIALFTLWMASGMLEGKAPSPPETDQPPLVQTKQSTGEVITRILTLEGQIMPDKAVTLRAETAGVVETRLENEGQPVAKGDVLVRLATDDREARLRQAKATVKQFELEYESARKLGEQGFQAENRVAGALAALEEARAKLAAIQEDISNSIFRAPFDGVLQEIYVETGDAVALGTEVARILSINPLVLEGYIPQSEIENINPKGHAWGHLPNGNKLEGNVRYISAEAHPETRTYRVEVAIANPDLRRLAGSSVTLHIPLTDVLSHSISPAFLALNAEGTLGVKVLAKNNTAKFMPVEIERTSPGEVWISGLPQQAEIITLGHGFVRDGDKVRLKTDTNAGNTTN